MPKYTFDVVAHLKQLEPLKSINKTLEEMGVSERLSATMKIATFSFEANDEVGEKMLRKMKNNLEFFLQNRYKHEIKLELVSKEIDQAPLA